MPLAEPPDEPLGLLLLPRKLEQFERREHARALLQIPRVVALEPGRFRTPEVLRVAAPLRQARRLRLPGVPRLVVFYHPLQYPLAQALRLHYERPEADRRLLKLRPATPDPAPSAVHIEVWYFRPDPHSFTDERGHTRAELLELDGLAVERAQRTVHAGTEEVLQAQTASLRERLTQLGVISSRAFLPGARTGRR